MKQDGLIENKYPKDVPLFSQKNFPCHNCSAAKAGTRFTQRVDGTIVCGCCGRKIQTTEDRYSCSN